MKELRIGDKIKFGSESRVYEVLLIEENINCDGGYGVATIDGYYFSIDKCKKVEI